MRASWGRFYQAQGINELQVEDGVDTFSPAQRADHFILSIEHAFTGGLSARLEAYYKDYDELRPRFENLFDPLVLIPELETDRVEVAATAGAVKGLELLLNDRSNGPWGWWLSYAWSRADETVGGVDVARSWDQRNSLNGGISWNSGPWDVALAGTWHTGWPTTPVTLRAGSSLSATAIPSASTPSVPWTRGPATPSPWVRRTDDLRRGHQHAGAEERLLRRVHGGDPGGADERLKREVDYWPRFVPNLGVLWKF